MIALLGITADVILLPALKIAKPVAVPFTFAFFLALLLHPVHARLRKDLPGGWTRLSVPATMIVLLLIVAMVVAGFWVAGDAVSEGAPEHADKLQHYWERNSGWLDNLGVSPETPDQIVWRVSDLAVSWLSSAFSLLIGAVLVFFFVLLMLLEIDLWRKKAEFLFARDTAAIDTCGRSRYLFVRTAVSVISGILAGLWLWILGVDFALLWGMLTFALNYVPNIGSVVSAVLPAVVALVRGRSPLRAACRGRVDNNGASDRQLR